MDNLSIFGKGMRDKAPTVGLASGEMLLQMIPASNKFLCFVLESHDAEGLEGTVWLQLG